ncbi:AEC family transporter [Anaerosacchariphilus polymeriproducens]|uniref:AEC family transporter n=1 Tax=Anaerosacchariphilus polymeriproducens TaxID=1812858 RepID=A0A371ARG5_9FIRM|nr:AEC family transporter [Anaerosacchariphilus polymeriproducens]RDU22165.1 AEC family transporter [Anaerosacchariphilus polymeriproducens]
MSINVILNQMGVIFLLIMTGFLLNRKGIVKFEENRLLSTLIVNVFNPALIISGVLGDEKTATFKEMMQVTLLAVIIYIILIVLGLFYPKITKIPKKDQVMSNLMILFSNIGFMGIPVLSGIYGKEVILLYITIFLIPFNILVYTYGIFLLTKDLKSGREKFQIKKIFNIGVLACIAAIIIFAFGIRLPKFAVSTINYLGSVTIPLSMITIGISLGATRLKEVFSDIQLYKVAVLKLLILPITLVFLIRPFVDNPVILGVTVILAGMPIGNISTLLANEYDLDSDLPTRGIVLTTLLSLITLPIVFMFL